MPDIQQKDFFISYAAANAQWAEWSAWQLESVGYSVIIQAWDFLPGGEFTVDIHNVGYAHNPVNCSIQVIDYFAGLLNLAANILAITKYFAHLAQNI